MISGDRYALEAQGLRSVFVHRTISGDARRTQQTGSRTSPLNSPNAVSGPSAPIVCEMETTQ